MCKSSLPYLALCTHAHASYAHAYTLFISVVFLHLADDFAFAGLYEAFIIMVLVHGCAFAIPSFNPISFSFRA